MRAAHVFALLLLAAAGGLLYFWTARSTAAEATHAGPPAAAVQRVPLNVPHSLAPGGLSPGTCIELKPAGKSQRTVFVDPGHGGLDPGAVGLDSGGHAVAEKTLTLAVGLELARRLNAAGYNVVLARTGDTDVARVSDQDLVQGALKASSVRLDTLARVACANAAHADVLISIHFDAFDDPDVGGIETVYDDARSFRMQNARVASAVHQAVLARFSAGGWDVPDRGIWKDSDTGAAALTNEGQAYGHLVELGPVQAGWVDHPSEMPGALIEPLFVTRPAEADVAASRDGQVAIAAGIVDGLKSYFGT